MEIWPVDRKTKESVRRWVCIWEWEERKWVWVRRWVCIWEWEKRRKWRECVCVEMKDILCIKLINSLKDKFLALIPDKLISRVSVLTISAFIPETQRGLHRLLKGEDVSELAPTFRKRQRRWEGEGGGERVSVWLWWSWLWMLSFEWKETEDGRNLWYLKIWELNELEKEGVCSLGLLELAKDNQKWVFVELYKDKYVHYFVKLFHVRFVRRKWKEPKSCLKNMVRLKIVPNFKQ